MADAHAATLRARETSPDVAVQQQLNELTALFQIVRAVASELNLPAMLQRLAQVVCEQSSWDSCDVMIAEHQIGHTRLVACYPPVQEPVVGQVWPLEASWTLHALEHREPLVVYDAQNADGLPTIRRSARMRGFWGVVVVPILIKELPAALWLYTMEPRQFEEREIRLAQAIADHVAIAVRNARSFETQREATERFQRLLTTQTDLIERVLAGASTASLTEAISQLLGNPVLLVGQLMHALSGGVPGPLTHEQQVAWARCQAAFESTGAARSWLSSAVEANLRPASEGVVTSGRLLDPALDCQMRVQPLAVGRHTLGYLVVPEICRPSEPLDDVIRGQAALALTVDVMRGFTAFEVENRLRSNQLRGLLDGTWTDRREMIERASFLGLDLTAPNGLVLLRPSAAREQATDAQDDGELNRLLAQLGRMLARRHPGITIVRHDAEVVLIVPAAGGTGHLLDVAYQVADTFEMFNGARPAVVVAPICSTLEAYAPALDEGVSYLNLCAAFARDGVVESQSLGAYRLLLSALRPEKLQEFVTSTLGPLLALSDQQGEALTGTLRAYLEASCSLQAAARALFLHISTVRYRLGKIEGILSCDLKDPETRFELGLALRLEAVARVKTTR